MMKPKFLKTMMIISGALLALALIGMSLAVSKPASIKQETTLISYSQKSQFDYTTYLKPSYLYGPPPAAPVAAAQYPQAVVGNIAFSYSFQPSAANASGTAWVEAVLENPGVWQKKLALAPAAPESGNYTLNFSLDVPQISQLFADIEKETGLPSSTRRVTVNAYFQSGAVLQVQSLPITLQSNLVVIPGALSLTQDAGSGKFDYTIKPVITPTATPAPDAGYPAAVIDSISFSYSFVPAASGTVTASVQAVLESQGVWQKKVVVAPEVSNSGSINMSFLLIPDQLKQQFDEIDKETGLTTSTRLVTLHAAVNTGKDYIVQNLPLTIKDGVLTVGGALQQQSGGAGKFDYTINLKTNSIYDTNTLKPPAAPLTTVPPSFDLAAKPAVTTAVAPAVLKPGQTAFINLIDKMTVNFGYQFAADKPVNNLKTTVDIVAVLEAPQSWSKTFPLLSTSRSGNIAVNFPVDLSGYTQLLSSIRTETGTSPDTYNVTVTANIHTTGSTQFGPIDETYSPAMKGTVKNNVLTWDKELTAAKAGAIKQTATVNNPAKILGLTIPVARTLFVVLSCIFAFFLLGLAVFYFMHRGPAPSEFEQKLQKIKKTYGPRIAESNGDLSEKSEVSVSMNSIEDLIKIADELGKPVVHQIGPSGKVHLYYVIDGGTRYQYSLVAAL